MMSHFIRHCKAHKVSKAMSTSQFCSQIADKKINGASCRLCVYLRRQYKQYRDWFEGIANYIIFCVRTGFKDSVIVALEQRCPHLVLDGHYSTWGAQVQPLRATIQPVYG